jgi:hypothetical protein
MPCWTLTIRDFLLLTNIFPLVSLSRPLPSTGLDALSYRFLLRRSLVFVFIEFCFINQDPDPSLYACQEK